MECNYCTSLLVIPILPLIISIRPLLLRLARLRRSVTPILLALPLGVAGILSWGALGWTIALLLPWVSLLAWILLLLLLLLRWIALLLWGSLLIGFLLLGIL